MKIKEFLISAIAVVISTAVALGAGEVILRIKNSAMDNYDIEMWRYARELKVRSPDPVLGHEHIPNAAALLQSTEIRTSDLGLRGGPVAAIPGKRRILVLGASITLGWGVPEQDTFTAVLEKMFKSRGEDVEVLNAGIGNYNAERYVELFFTRLTALAPTDIIVHYFLRDAETLDAGGGNFMLQHSELAVTLWIAANRVLGVSGEKSLVDHYKAVYDPQAPGFLKMEQSLSKLSDYARQHDIRLYFAMMPDVHNLTNYPFGAIHATMRQFAQAHGYTFIDLLPAFEGLKPEQVWAMPGDPHPNALGHALMAKSIFPILSGATKAPPASVN
jgi:lysophospholipase L1-like esterase